MSAELDILVAEILITAHGIRNDVEYDALPSPHSGFVEDLLKVTGKIQDCAVSRWQDLTIDDGLDIV